MIEIRQYSGPDLEVVKHLIIQLQAHERQFDPNLIEPTQEFADNYIPGVLESVAKHRGIILVAAHNDAVVGFVAGYAQKDAQHKTEHFYIAELVVAESHRGQGIGTQLIRAIEKFARANEFDRLIIGVVAANEGAHRLYKTLGYMDYGVELSKKL